MRRGYLFWGSVFILLSVLFLLKATGFIRNVLDFFWPLALILAGVWVIMAIYLPKSFDDGEAFSVDKQGASKATIKFSTGAGRVEIGAGAASGYVISGTKAAGMSVKQSIEGDHQEVKIEAGPSIIPFIGPSSGVWKYQLAKDFPLSLKMEAGASQIKMDLRELLVTYVKVETGASSVSITVPENAGTTNMDIEAGAASVDILVPERVGAKIRVKEGVSALDIDPNRFPRLEGGYYQSADYEASTNKVDLTIESGVGTIKIH